MAVAAKRHENRYICFVFIIQKKRTRTEELWNAASHGLGILLGFSGLFILLAFDTGKTSFSTFGIVVYGLTLMMLYSASTIYHLMKAERKKTLWRKIDHIGIYFLIAGTYTPVALITLETGSGWFIFYTVWGIAAAGSIIKLFYTGKYEIFSLLAYLFMGWLILFDLQDLITKVTDLGVFLLMLGGAFYTLGIIFYVVQKIPYHHFIWHLFVLGGSISHFFFIFLDVI